MDAPLVGRGELLYGASFDEGGEGLFDDGSCSAGPYWSPLSLERDRRGGIYVGLDGHEALVDDSWGREQLRLDTERRAFS